VVDAERRRDEARRPAMFVGGFPPYYHLGSLASRSTTLSALR
jgi:hypothetical protein